MTSKQEKRRRKKFQNYRRDYDYVSRDCQRQQKTKKESLQTSENKEPLVRVSLETDSTYDGDTRSRSDSKT